MAAVSIPGQSKRWGNESTNFYQYSKTSAPGVPSRDKVYRCEDNQYTHTGHYHVGTKAINQDAPLDTYGTASARKLRSEDQRLPRPLFTSTVQDKHMSQGRPVNLYQSHHQRYHSYAMSKAPLKRASTEVPEDDALARSLSQAFYVTSYQSNHSWQTGTRPSISNPNVTKGESGAHTLRESLLVRRNSLSEDNKLAVPIRQARITSAPPLRIAQPQPQSVAAARTGPPLLQRRRSFSAIKQVYPSKGEMLKDIFTAFPAPVPQEATKKQSRPSSAVSLRAGKIPKLRQSNAWI